MPRAAKGRGTVYQRADGRWVARLPTPDGPRVRYTATKEAAEDALAALRLERERGATQPRGAGALTVGTLLDRWLAGKEGTITEGALRRHRDAVRLRLRPAFGTRRVLSLEPDELRRFYAALGRAGTLSPSTIRKTHITLKAALAQAVKDGLLARNVAALVDGPKVQPAEQHPLDPEQVRRLVAAATPLRLGALWVVAVYTGARLGELLGTRWSDYDLAAGRLTIVRTLAMERGTINPKTKRRRLVPSIVQRTKRTASRRTIPLPAPAVDALRRHKARQDAERAAAAVWTDTRETAGVVFRSELGTLVNPSNVENRDWPALRAAADLPEDVTPHDLRHTAATAWLLAGVPLPEVAQLLGHASPQVTATVYAHVLARARTDAGAVLEQFYRRGAETQSDAISGQ